jgi:alkanesulfonate monooxygenase SsuD/methylene tetrahydromethanopterin reductase-like flavin-dependent oxidoreductase (luciferase family)
MDYGHELLFGTFITPAAQPPHHAVELAVVADRAGLDLVTFQDHPYQPGFLDTWRPSNRMLPAALGVPGAWFGAEGEPCAPVQQP